MTEQIFRFKRCGGFIHKQGFREIILVFINFTRPEQGFGILFNGTVLGVDLFKADKAVTPLLHFIIAAAKAQNNGNLIRGIRIRAQSIFKLARGDIIESISKSPDTERIAFICPGAEKAAPEQDQNKEWEHDRANRSCVPGT